LSTGGAAAGGRATGGTSSTGGVTSATGGSTLSLSGTGGVSSTGGSTSAGATVSTSNTGGTSSTGGATSADADAGSGCTSAHFEAIQSSTGLCVAEMATIKGPPSDAGSTDYRIDVTEVTEGQYDAWLATNPELPASDDETCGYVSSYAKQGPSYRERNWDHYPVLYVDWCDAYAYCRGVGKQLCGAMGGGAVDTAGYDDATLSQWYRSCSSAGANIYPYRGRYQRYNCDGLDNWTGGGLATIVPVPVGTMEYCMTWDVVYDLSGNAAEWEDSCSGELCRIRGGSYLDSDVTCAKDSSLGRTTAASNVGFRCCSR
jgi:hypothetical protein